MKAKVSRRNSRARARDRQTIRLAIGDAVRVNGHPWRVERIQDAKTLVLRAPAGTPLGATIGEGVECAGGYFLVGSLGAGAALLVALPGTRMERM